MVDFLKSIDDKTNLAGTNRLELIMFTLGDSNSEHSSLYGINVFKVRELITLPNLVEKPNRHECCPGIANVRGKAVPVIDLQKYYGYPSNSEQNILVITEFNSSTQGFIVNRVDEIIQLDWEHISEPPDIVSELTGVNYGNTLTGISILEDDTMLMIVDVEQVIAEVLGTGLDTISTTEMTTRNKDRTVFFADDSRVAREQISAILKKMGLNFHFAKNGQEALDSLGNLATTAEAEGKRLSDTIEAIITDVEMPVLDGYMLTRKVKEDSRFDGIPVIMHSSLSAAENIRLGEKVGVDAYIPKLKPKEFSTTLDRVLNSNT
jgi:two-component system chemotaxis response regulator CheV